MKGSMLVLGIFAGAIALFGGILWFFLSNAEDQSYLTERHQAKIVSAKIRADRYDVVYRYEVDGKTYYGSEWFYKKHFSPSSGMHVCVDPKSPRTHAPTISENCGEVSLIGNTRKGRPHLEEG